MSIDSYKKAGFFSRLFALLIDLIIYFIIYFFLRFFHLENLTIFIFIFYFFYFNSIFGQTLGKKVLGIKVVDKNLKPPSLILSFVREIFKFFVSPVLLNFGFISMIINKNKQTWHDKLAKTYVIQLDKEGNPISLNEEITVNKLNKFLFYFLFLIILFVYLFPLMYIFLFEFAVIKGKAMEPNYKNGQYYIIKKFDRNFKRGDVVIFDSPINKNVRYIGRIVGLPNERIIIVNKQVYINGEKLDENYIEKQNTTLLRNDSFLKENKELLIPSKKYFVLGDNRENSIDSRNFGFIDKKDIIGKIWFCYRNCK